MTAMLLDTRSHAAVRILHSNAFIKDELLSLYWLMIGSTDTCEGCLDSVDWNDGMEQWNGLDWNGGMEWNGMRKQRSTRRMRTRYILHARAHAYESGHYLSDSVRQCH